MIEFRGAQLLTQTLQFSTRSSCVPNPPVSVPVSPAAGSQHPLAPFPTPVSDTLVTLSSCRLEQPWKPSAMRGVTTSACTLGPEVPPQSQRLSYFFQVRDSVTFVVSPLEQPPDDEGIWQENTRMQYIAFWPVQHAGREDHESAIVVTPALKAGAAPRRPKTILHFQLYPETPI